MVESTSANQPKEKAIANKKDERDEVELMAMKGIKQKASPFLSKKQNWDEDEEGFEISAEIKKGITDELFFTRPSIIQAVAIPLILGRDETGNYQNLIAQSKNGSGKTGAFTIGSAMRVDPTLQKPQVLCIVHIRELAAQITDVYTKLTKFTDIKVSDLVQSGKWEGCQIVVSTLGTLKNKCNARQPIDFSGLRVIVIDEVDFFFHDDDNKKQLEGLNKGVFSKLKQKIQWILFSATYPEHVIEEVSKIAKEASSIQCKKEKLQLDHIRQFVIQCPPKGKVDFLGKIFKTMVQTQSIIFVNTRNFAEKLLHLLNKLNCSAVLMFGKMDPDERDEIMDRFRKGEAKTIITTNMLARGIDVPEVELVINFDVPTLVGSNRTVLGGDPESYLHRIGRAGRFGTPGIALTLLDREEDKDYFDEIIEHFDMTKKVTELRDEEHLAQVYAEINSGDEFNKV